MPKPTLIETDAILEREIIATMLAGLKEWRPDLNYPESFSDMQGCVRGLLQMYAVTRRPLIAKLKLRCNYCDGLGNFRRLDERGTLYIDTCKHCDSKGYIER